MGKWKISPTPVRPKASSRANRAVGSRITPEEEKMFMDDNIALDQ